mmetsp:Transcript_19010/g.38626  ORF Transcript_19010/g.38626 Transcript_19010/m.38626 type:complete len:132 (-) Transcript_19010:888-1283(-)
MSLSLSESRQTTNDLSQHATVQIFGALLVGSTSSATALLEKSPDLKETLPRRSNILLQLAATSPCAAFLARWDTKLQKICDEGIGKRRDSMDMLGKLPLALNALDACITTDELLVDVARESPQNPRRESTC